MSAQPGRLFTREQLLRAMAGDHHDASDRNVDFVINRLRRKLNDPARAPRFIATQYGEGYVWIAAVQSPGRGGLLVIGPLRGLDPAGSREPLSGALERLHRRLMERCSFGQEIALAPDWDAHDGKAGRFRFSVRVDVNLEGPRPQAAFTLRHEPDRRTLRVIRRPFEAAAPGPALADVADQLAEALWRDYLRAPGEVLQPGGPPLELRMQEAALALSPVRGEGWRYIAERAAQGLARNPDDAELGIIVATCRFAQLVLAIDIDSGDPAAYRALEDEIEALVLRALPGVRGDPLFSLAAARLLFVSHRGHLPLAETLLAEAVASSNTFASALSLSGAFKAYAGDLAGAVRSYDQALGLCEPGTEFELYLQVLKSQALIAGGDREAARAILARLLEVKPADRAVRIFYLDPDRAPDEAAQQELRRLTPELARQMLGRLMFGTVRNFSRPEHGRAILAGPLRHLLERFGPAVLPGELPRGLAPAADAARRRSA
jgi:tetratricopeptide (TPR) repeat protein